MIPYVLAVIIAYLIGSLSFSIIYSRKIAGFDIREKGSKASRRNKCFKNNGKKSCNIYINV